MLTRLEVDGFKNLHGLSIDFGPLTCIAGPNGVGKSNLFDVLTFLAELAAGKSFYSAASQIREGVSADSTPTSIFTAEIVDARIQLAVEMLVPATVVDAFQARESVPSTHLRYELHLALERRGAAQGPDRIRLERESLRWLTKTESRQRLPWMPRNGAFASSALKAKKGTNRELISTDLDRGQTVVKSAQEGNQGRRLETAVDQSDRTVLSTYQTAADPIKLAARVEMTSWRLFAPQPAALRTPSPYASPTTMDAHGAHLAASLRRIADLDERGPDALLHDVSLELSGLIGRCSVSLDSDDQRHLHTIYLQMGDGPRLPARCASDGTLRFLSLAVLANDPEWRGLLCMEEPENGIHPARIPAVLDLLRGLSCDVREAVDSSNPLRQAILNTHSPRVVQVLDDDPGILLASERYAKRAEQVLRSLSLSALAGTWRCELGTPWVTRASLVDYLRVDGLGQTSIQDYVADGD